MIKPATIEQIKSAMDIVDVVGDFVDLKKSGQSYKGLSPFTEEKTPSFFVSPAKGIFKCFSSGKGGDSIKFIMEHEGLSYYETLKYLGQKFNIEIKEEEETPEEVANRNEKESLFIVLNFAKERYKDLLLNNEEGQSLGLSYFKERGFGETTIDKFDLGYSLNDWDGLKKEAEKKQYSLDLLEKSGLIIKKEEGKVYDRFRGRVMFPIHNLTGKVIGFGARILTNEKGQPKYINSPETEIYHKSNVLYGMFQAKNAVRNEDNCYLVEGYTDVISLHQAGIENVVSSSGTALTKEQIRLISRYTENITVLYDGDPAGIRASMRGIDMILEQGMNVHAVVFPEGQDPDSYLKELGGPEFREYLQKESTDFITFKTKMAVEDAKGDPLKKAAVIKDIVESIAKVSDGIKRAVFFQQCSRLLEIDETVLIQEYNKTVIRGRKETRQGPPTGSGYEPMGMGPGDEPLELLVPDMEHSYDEAPQEVEDSALKSLQEQESEIVRILLQFAGEEMEDRKFGAYLLEEIQDVEFKDPVNQRIVNIFREKAANDEFPSLQYFVSMEQGEMQQKVVDLVSQRHEISENWEKHQIYVTRENDDLQNLAFHSVLRLKWRIVRHMLKENFKELSSTENIEGIETLQRKHIRLKEAEMAIAKLLGNVTAG